MEIWCYRKMLRVSWTRNVTNEEVLKKVKKEIMRMKRIRKRQLESLRHIIRKGKLKNLIVTEK